MIIVPAIRFATYIGKCLAEKKNSKMNFSFVMPLSYAQPLFAPVFKAAVSHDVLFDLMFVASQAYGFRRGRGIAQSDQLFACVEIFPNQPNFSIVVSKTKNLKVPSQVHVAVELNNLLLETHSPR